MFRPGQIGVPWQGTFKMYPAYTHWAHWSHLLSVLPMYPACAWWVFGSLSPVRVIKNRWVFDVKPDGRKRARLVAKGFSQVEGKDFDQIFSPVV